MSKIKIHNKSGFTRVWIDGQEIESVERCTLDLDAERLPIATLKIHINDYEIEEEVDKQNIKITR